MLDSHPAIACGPEFKLLQPLAQSFMRMAKVFGPGLEESYGLNARDLAESYGRQIAYLLNKSLGTSGKRRVAEKTPQNAHVFAPLSMILPKSPFVHLIRDGRDVICSLLKQTWMDPATGERMEYTRDIRKAAEYWVKAVNDARRVPDDVRKSRFIEVKYEQLVRQPEKELKRLLKFVGEPWHPAVLKFHEQKHDYAASEVASHGRVEFEPLYTRAIGRWEGAWSDEERQAVKDVAGDLLISLGYCHDLDW